MSHSTVNPTHLFCRNWWFSLDLGHSSGARLQHWKLLWSWSCGCSEKLIKTWPKTPVMGAGGGSRPHEASAGGFQWFGGQSALTVASLDNGWIFDEFHWWNLSFDSEPDALVLKELMNFAELGPLVWSTAPALMHQVQDFFGHVAARSSWRRRSHWRRRWEQVVAIRMKHVLEVFNDLVVSQLWQGQVLTMAEYLPQKGTERPNVAFIAPQTLKNKKR